MATAPVPTSSLPPPGTVGTPILPLSFRTILAVEARKMIDTRGAHVLIGVILVVALGLLVWQLTWQADQTDVPEAFAFYLNTGSWVVVFLAPVAGLLAMTSEWTHRTALTTYALAPRRTRVLAAKLVAAVGCSFSVFALVVAMSAGVAAIGDAPFTDAGRLVAGFAGVVLLHTLLAAGIGAAAGLTPPGVVVYLTAPTAVGFAAGQISGEALRWIDLFGVYKRFRSDQPFEELGSTLTAVVLWIVVPLVVGVILNLRREAA